MKTRIMVMALVMGVLTCVAKSGTYYWDGATTANYQPTSGVWGADTVWTLNGTALTTWPGGTTHGAIFPAAGASTATISGAVSVNSLSLATANESYNSVTGGTLNVGAGGISVAGNKSTTNAEAIWSDVTLDANQTWSIAASLWLHGVITDGGSGYDINKTGASILHLYNGGSAYSGTTTLAGGLRYIGSDSGTPIGTGSLELRDTAEMWLAPLGTGHAVALTSGTDAGGAITLTNASRLRLLKGNETSLSFTFGNAGDGGSAFVRNGRASLVVYGTGNSPSMGATETFFIAGGSVRVPMRNGMVDPFVTLSVYGSNGQPDFAGYTDVGGFINLAYNLTNTFTGADNTKKVYNSNARTISANTAVYALRNSSTISLNSGVVLSIGDNTTGHYAGLIPGTITNSSGASGGYVDFGASEGVVVPGTTATGALYVPIAGSGGITIASGANGILTLHAENTYSGVTTVNQSILNVGSGGTSGSLGASDSLMVSSSSTLNFNRSNTYSWSGAVNGAGALNHAGTGTLNLTLADSIVGTLKNTGGGTLKLFGSASAPNVVGFGFQGVSAGTVEVGSGIWIVNGMGNAKGTLLVSGGTVIATNGTSRSFDCTVILSAGVVSIECPLFGESAGTGTVGFDVSGGEFNMGPGANANLGGAMAFTGLQTGGDVTLSTDSATLGTTSNAGRSPATTNVNSLTLSGGRMMIPTTLKSSAQPAGGTNVNINIFTFDGGVLSAATVEPQYFAGGTMTNAGGVLAPGTVGLAGLTSIKGNYLDDSADATLAIDIGGGAAATAYTNSGAYYDKLTITNATFSGKLSVNLINGYVPPTSATKFTNVVGVLSLAAGFANVVGGKVWCADGYSRFDVLTNALPANSMILSNYTANGWASAAGGNWTDGGNWSVAEPNGEAMGAYFDDTLAAPGTVNVDAARTVRALTFDNANSYTLSGSMLTLVGDAAIPAQITVVNGSHSIATALALSNALTIAVANAADILTLSGDITGNQAVTKTGAGTVALGGNNTFSSLTVSGGVVSNYTGTSSVGSLALAAGTMLIVKAGDLTSTGLTLAAGSTLDFTANSSGILRILAGSTSAIDTVAEVNAAITAGSITRGGAAVDTTSFLVTEEGGYVVVQVKSLASGVLIRIY